MGKKENEKAYKDNSKEKGSKKRRIIIEFKGSEILERKASKFGTGAHVIIPKEHAGKKVKIIVDEGGKEDE